MNILKDYKAENIKFDLLGGISVAAISIPVGIAYAEIAGMPPESGLYTAILALIAYFILGGGRQVIIGPDSATVTLFTSSVIAVSAGSGSSAPQIMMMITVAAGLLMFVAGFLRLGFIANFLSKPILIGYLNGVSVLLIVSQLGKLTGIKLEQTGFFLRIFEVFEKIALLHLPTFALGVFSLLFLYVVKKISIKIPSQLLLIVITIVVVELFDLRSAGIGFLQQIQNPYPSFMVPDVSVFGAHYTEIFIAAAAVVFVSFSGEIPVVRAFTKSGRGFDANKEFYALGLADILIGFFRGYPVSGADSRTAVNVAVGGRTKLVNVVAAVLMLLVILLVPGLFAKIPLVTFGAIIIFAAIGMFKRGAGYDLLKSERKEFWVFLVCLAGVLLFGVYQGILFAVILSFIQLIAASSKPREFELAFDEATGSVTRYEAGSGLRVRDDVLIYRFDSSMLFYNSGYFSDKLYERADAKKGLRYIIIDAEPVNLIDLTASTELGGLIREFANAGVRVAFAGANEGLIASVKEQLTDVPAGGALFYPTVRSAFEGLESKNLAK
jgi:high affinity sulfate transporter 1